MAESTPTTSNSEDGQIHGYNNSDVSYRIASSIEDCSPLPITFLLYIRISHVWYTPIYGFSIIAYPCQGGSNGTVISL